MAKPKSSKIKYVKQEDSKGCAIACFAMIRGMTYAQVANQFSIDLKKHGLTSQQIWMYLSDHGYSVIEKLSHAWMDLHQQNARMVIPFAPLHWVDVKQYANSPLDHAVVMDAKGRVYDPSAEENKNLNAYYQVRSIMGLFKDEAP